MFRRYLDNLYLPPDTAGTTGGTTATSAAASVTGGSSEPSTSGVSSGTASEAMIKAAMAASSAETPAEGATTADTPAQALKTGSEGATPDATAQAVTDGTSAATEKPGYIPQARHDAVLKNARRDTEAAVRKEYGNLKPQQLNAAWKIAREVQADPEAFYHKLGESLGISRQPATESRLAASIASLEPALRSEDGKTAYTADQVKELLTSHAGETRAAVMQELKPLLQFFTSESGRREQEATSRQTAATADTVLKTAEALPYFKENKAAIGAKLKEMEPGLKKQLGAVGAMYHAYNSVLQESVYPNMDKSAEERVRASFAKKAAASGGVHPGGSTGGEGKKPELNNVTQLAAHMAQLATASV